MITFKSILMTGNTETKKWFLLSGKRLRRLSKDQEINTDQQEQLSSDKCRSNEVKRVIGQGERILSLKLIIVSQLNKPNLNLLECSSVACREYAETAARLAYNPLCLAGQPYKAPYLTEQGWAIAEDNERDLH